MEEQHKVLKKLEKINSSCKLHLSNLSDRKTIMSINLYITGAGVSADSGIPTFRGEDGFWTIGSVNYTPQEMATRAMYLQKPDEFLVWYFKRFAKYRHITPNEVHSWLADKRLITQNIDGLDGKAGNDNYIPIHGRLDKVTVLETEGIEVDVIDAPWDEITELVGDEPDDRLLRNELLNAFKINPKTMKPEKGISLKPFVLLFDEYYTEMYRLKEAQKWMKEAKKLVFIGTSFSVGITAIALEIAVRNNCDIHVVDPKPVELGAPNVTYHQLSASDYINSHVGPKSF